MDAWAATLSTRAIRLRLRYAFSIFLLSSSSLFSYAFDSGKRVEANFLKGSLSKNRVLLSCRPKKCPYFIGEEIFVRWTEEGEVDRGFSAQVTELNDEGDHLKATLNRFLYGTAKLPNEKQRVLLTSDLKASIQEEESEDPKNLNHRLELGGGTSYSDFFTYGYLDFRVLLSFFSYPLYLDIGLQPGFLLTTNPDGVIFSMQLPLSVRYEIQPVRWLRLGPFVGGSFGLFQLTDTSSTSSFDFISGAELDFGGIVSVEIKSGLVLFARGSRRLVGIGAGLFF